VRPHGGCKKMNNSKNVLNYMFGSGAIDNLKDILDEKRDNGYIVYYIDEYFKDSDLIDKLPIDGDDELFFVQTKDEPKTDRIDELKEKLVTLNKSTY